MGGLAHVGLACLMEGGTYDVEDWQCTDEQ